MADEGGSSSSSDPNTSSQHALARDVNQLVEQIAANTKNTPLFGQLIPKALDYIKSDEAGAKKQHILCSRGDREPEWQLHACMIRVLSFKTGPEIEEWLAILAKALYSCADCFKGYLKAKMMLQKTYLAGFPEAAIERFLTHVDEWEENIALDLFERRKVAPGGGLGFLSTAELYAVLSAVAVREKIRQRVKDTMTLHKLSSTMPEIPAGLLRLATEPDEKSRKWAAMQLEGRKAEAMGMSEGLPTTRPVQKVVMDLAKQLADGTQSDERLDQLWSATSLIYQCAPTAFGPLAPNILPNLQDTTTRLPHLLRAFDGILRSRGASLWQEVDEKDSEYPLVLLSSILDNAAFLKEVGSVTTAAAMQPYTAWMTSLLASLSSPSSPDQDSSSSEPYKSANGLNGASGSTSTLRRQDTPPPSSSRTASPSNLYNEVLKRLTNFLLERMQQGLVASKKLAMDQGLNLLTTELSMVTDLDSPQMSTISSVVGIYARTVATLAFKGKLPGSTETLSSEDPLRQAAQTLVQQVLDADCLAVKDAIHTLARITQFYLAKWKLRKRPGEKTGEEIYAMAANERYPSPSICTELWAHSYDVFNATASPSELAQTTSLFLKPLTACILMGEPAIPVHVLPTPRNESQSYAPYKQRVKACVTAISRPMRAMRGSLPSLLTDLTDADVSAGQADLQELCVRLAPDLIVLNLSPVSEIHNAAQNVVRAAYTDAESRLDVFKALLSSTTGALVGIERALELFREACHHLVEANEAAKWIVRSGADILEALCGRTGGLLRSGAEHSYIDRKTEDLLVLQDLLPRIWELMCNSLAVIFQKTPKWAEHINREDMVAWFRDVSIFSTQLTEQVGTFTKAVNTKRRKERRAGQLASQDEEDAEDFIQSCFAEPLKEAIQWLRINDLEIVNETMSFIDKALEVFTGDVELPTHVKAAMLKFVEEQIKVESADQRKTLLSINELMDLQVRIAPESKRSSSENAIEISDSDDDASTSAKTPAKAMPSSQSWLASMGSPNKSSQGSSSKDAKQRKKMRQQKLNFQPADVIDVDALDSLSSSSSHSSGAFAGQLKSSTSTGMQAWPKAPQQTVSSSSSSSSSNKYKSASAAHSAGTSKKSSSSSLPKPNANMAALRQQHAATRTFAHMRPAQPRIPAANDMRQPVAPAASSSVTGADRTGKPSVPTSASSDSDSDSGSDEEEDEDGQPKGLAALEQARTSPGKKHARAIMAKVKPQQPARRTQLMGENDIEKARKERQEAERKRLLRAATDLRNLHFSILEWDWYHQGDTYPPSRGNTLPPFHPVADKFRNADEYGATFGPLLMLECWMQLQQAKEQYERGEVSTYPCEVQGRVSVDQFVDVSVVMTTQTPASFRVGESDVVIMRQREDGLAPDQRASKPRILIAKVEMFKRSPKGSQLTLRCVLEGDTQGISSHLVNRSIWDIGSLFTLSTVNREFGALLTLPHYDLVRDVMQAKVAPRYRATREEVNKMVQTYGTNEPQAEAILGALQSQGFSLVQGPPGTGKTKTICALVAHFVATRRTPQPISTAGTRGPIKPAVTAKLLMCAPSNAAIDEVARRAKAGMRGPDGKDIKPKVVRIGRDDAMNVAVKDISLDNLVEQAMAKSAGQLGDGTSVDQLEAEMRAIRHDKDVKQSELDQLRLAGASDSVTAARLKHIEMEIRTLVSRRMAVAQRLDEARDKRQTGMRQMDADRRRIRNEILLDADVICSTLSGAGHEGLATLPIDFETVIIDEAAQAIELSTLIPLRYGCKRCILVGDPKQLPPTVISPKAERLRYSQSLFKRMYDQAQQDVYLLSIQYRMHPDISMHPSAAFYGGALRDGPHMDQLTARPWHRDDLLAPFRFFSIKGQERQTRGHSFVNPDEAHAALALYERLVRSSPDFDFDGKVGLVTGYKAQMIELKRVFQQRYGSDIGDRVDFNTVDGFQGQEKDVIIFSLVRSGRTGLGFLEDERRINVAVTRAKSSLFILGNAEGLREASRREGLWRMLVDEAEKRGALRVGNKSTFQQTAIGGGRAGGSDQQRKGGRARPAGWLAAEASAAAGGREGSTSGGSSTAVSSRTASPSPAKKTKLDGGAAESSARPPPAAPPRPPLPAGLQTMRPGANGGMTSTSVRGPGSTPAASPRARPTPPSVTGGSGIAGGSGSTAMPAGLQTRRPPAPAAAAAAAPPRPAAPANGNGGGGGGGGGTRVVRAGNSGANPNAAGQPTFRPARPPPRPAQNPQRPPGRPLPPPGSGGNVNGGGPKPRPPGPSAPSQAAMDAMFVKKRKR